MFDTIKNLNLIIIFFLFLLISCSNNTSIKNLITIKVSSNSWENQGKIPLKYARQNVGGQNISPQVSWSKIEQATWYLVIIVDHHPIANNWLHWVVLLPANITTLPENTTGNLSLPAKELKNTFGNYGYDGPAPPPPDVHDYHIVVMALDCYPNLNQNLTWNYIENQVKSCLIGQGELIAYFQVQK